MRVLSTVLIASGLLMLVWAAVIWRFGDPVTGVWYRVEQHRLEASYSHRADRFQTLPAAAAVTRRVPARAPLAAAPPVERWPVLRVRLARAAAAYASALSAGDPVGQLSVPRLGLHTIVVDGTSSADLRMGPGLDRRTSLPGRGRLVYIAGHRTTFGAPFSAIDTIRPGDPIELRLPYATFRYVVSGHRIVAANDLGALRQTGRAHEQLVLQACHPRFFARQRYLVDARLVVVLVRDHGRTTAVRPPAA